MDMETEAELRGRIMAMERLIVHLLSQTVMQAEHPAASLSRWANRSLDDLETRPPADALDAAVHAVARQMTMAYWDAVQAGLPAERRDRPRE